MIQRLFFILLFSTNVYASDPIVTAVDQAPKSAFSLFAYDFEIGGQALKTWVETVIDYHLVESFPWRSGFVAGQINALLQNLNVADERVQKLLPKDIQHRLNVDYELKNEIKKTFDESLNPKFKLLGIDGKPYQAGLVDVNGNPIHPVPPAPSSNVKPNSKAGEIILDTLQKGAIQSQNHRDLIRKKWFEIIKNIDDREKIFQSIPFEAHGVKEKVFITKLNPKILLAKKVGIDFLKNVDVTLDGGETLELKAKKPYTSQSEFIDHLKILSKRLGNEAAIFNTEMVGAERSGAFHFHASIKKSLLSKEELNAFMQKYRFKNALHTSYQKKHTFTIQLNGFLNDPTNKGNIRFFGDLFTLSDDAFHFEFRELPESLPKLIQEFNELLGDLESYPPQQRLKIANSRLDQSIAKLIAGHPKETILSLKELNETLEAIKNGTNINEAKLRASKALLDLAHNPNIPFKSTGVDKLKILSALDKINPELKTAWARLALQLATTDQQELEHAANIMVKKAERISHLYEPGVVYKLSDFTDYELVYKNLKKSKSNKKLQEPKKIFKETIQHYFVNEPKQKKSRLVFIETESHLRFLSDAGYKNEAKNYLKTIIENELDYIQYHPWVNQREANVLKFINDSEAYLKSHDPLSLKYADTLYHNALKNEGRGSELIKEEMDRIFERYNTKLKTQHNCLKDFNDLIKFVFQRT